MHQVTYHLVSSKAHFILKVRLRVAPNLKNINQKDCLVSSIQAIGLYSMVGPKHLFILVAS